MRKTASFPPRASRRLAFTLVELLVVIAIIGILVSLLLPAVQAAREAARRSQCKNQLKQMGLAMHNHVDTFKVFPTGGTRPWPRIEDYSQNGKPLGPKQQGLSWAFQILPFLEESSVHDLDTTDEIVQSPVGLYYCPSRRGPTQNSTGGFWLMDYAGLQAAPGRDELGDLYDRLMGSDGKAGCNRGFAFWGTRAHPSGDFTMPDRERLGSQYYGFNGVIVRCSYNVTPGSDGAEVQDMGYDSPVSFNKIVDGSSKTGLVTEKWLSTETYLTNAWHDDRGWSDGWDPDTIRLTICAPRPDSAPQGGDAFSAGSAHPGGVNIVFADGAVRTLTYSIDFEIFNRIGHRSDGEQIDADVL